MVAHLPDLRIHGQQGRCQVATSSAAAVIIVEEGDAMSADPERSTRRRSGAMQLLVLGVIVCLGSLNLFLEDDVMMGSVVLLMGLVVCVGAAMALRR